MGIFQRLNEQRGITVVLVTHEQYIAEHTRRIVRLQDGRVVSDAPVPNPRRAVRTGAPAALPVPHFRSWRSGPETPRS